MLNITLTCYYIVHIFTFLPLQKTVGTCWNKRISANAKHPFQIWSNRWM